MLRVSIVHMRLAVPQGLVDVFVLMHSVRCSQTPKPITGDPTGPREDCLLLDKPNGST